MATGLVSKLRAIGDAAGNAPDEVQVEFGIVLNAEPVPFWLRRAQEQTIR